MSEKSLVKSLKSVKNSKPKGKAKVERTHVILDIYKCDDETLAKADILKKKITKMLEQFNLDVKIRTFYQFEPFGVTATVFANGVQFTLHTWPEYKSGALDLYCFKGRKLAMQIIGEFKKIFESAEYDMKVRQR